MTVLLDSGVPTTLPSAEPPPIDFVQLVENVLENLLHSHKEQSEAAQRELERKRQGGLG